MKKIKFSKRVRSILALCIVTMLIVSTFVVALHATSSTSITWDFSGKEIYGNTGSNELRYATIEEYVKAGKLPELEGLHSSSADGSQFVFWAKNGLMARATGHFIARVADNSPITAEVSFRANNNDMRPIIQAAPTANGPWVTVSMTYSSDYEKGPDGKYPGGKYTISTDGIGEGNCYVKYIIPSESEYNSWYWDFHCLNSFTFTKNENPELPDEDPELPDKEPEFSEDAIAWDFTQYNGVGKVLDNIMGKPTGMVGSYCDANGQWRLEGDGLQAVISGTLVIQMADNSPFVAKFYDNGSGMRPTVKVSSTVDGPWTVVTPMYTQVEGTSELMLSIAGIGEGNCYLQYTISGTDWGNYWNHKLLTISFEKWVAPALPDGKIAWDFTQYNGVGKNLSEYTGNLEGMVGNYCDANGQWRLEGQGLQAVISGTMIIQMAENSSFVAEFVDNGSGLRPTIKVSKSSNGPWTTVTPQYSAIEGTGKLILSIDGIGKGNCYLQYTISGTGWSDYWNHKLLTVKFDEWYETEEDTSHLPKCDTNVVFDRFKNTTYWDFRECYKVTSNQFFAGIEGGVFPNTMPYEGGKPYVTMRVGKNSPIVVCYAQKDVKAPKFYVSGDGIDWKEIEPDLIDVNSKGQKRAIFNGIGYGNMFFQFEFPQDNNDMVSGRGWIVTLESISYNLAGGVADPDVSGKVKWNFTKYNGNNQNLANITGDLEGMMNSYCDANGQWRCDSSGLQAVLSGTMIFATKENSPLEIVYAHTSNDVKFSVKVAESIGGPWTDLAVEPTVDGTKYVLSTDGIGKGKGFVYLSITDTTWDNFHNFKLRSISFVGLGSTSDEILAEGMKKINFVSPKWNQAFDLTKHPEIVGFNGAFVSDKPGYMRMDMDWNTFTINTDNKSSLEFVMDNNSSVVLNITTHGPNLEDRPSFYVSSDKKKWTKIKPQKVENLGVDAKIGTGDYIIRYTFDGIGKKNIFFKFEFGVKKGEKYTLIGLRDITFTKNTTYVLPDEPILDSVIIFDAQKDSTYYDFRACDEVTDNMFYGGKDRGVFPCTTTTTGHQPGITIKVAKNSPISVRYKDLGMGVKPIYGVSTDKIKWTIIECDWSDKDAAGDIVDVINSVGAENIYFRFEFPQTQKEFSASQGWLLTLQSICYNEYVGEETDSNPVDTPVEEEEKDLVGIIESLRNDKTNEKPDNTSLYTVIIIITSVIVLVGASATILIFMLKKRKR